MSNVEYFQHLSLEDTFNRLCHIFGKRWAVFLSITVLAYLIIGLVTWGAMMLVLPSLSRQAYAYANENGEMDMTLYFSQVLLLTLVDSAIYYAIMCVADGAIIRAVAEIYVGQVPTVHNTLAQGAVKIGHLFCTALLIGTVIGIPALLIISLIIAVAHSSEAVYFCVLLFALVFFCLWVWVIVVTYLIYPSIMVENQGIISSIKRSWELSKEHRWYIFTTILLFYFLKALLSQMCKSIGYGGNEGAVLAAHILGLIVNVLFASLGSM